MRIKFFILTLILTSFFFNAHSKPRCDLFYDELYNTNKFPRDVDFDNFSEVKTLGIRLQQESNKEKTSWQLKKNKDGYFSVGKVTKISVHDQISVGDIILEVNGKDIRKDYKGNYNISDNFEEGEIVKIKFLRKNKDKKKNKLFEIDLKNELFDYNEPALDFFVENLTINEKEGSFNATIETDYAEFVGPKFAITNIAHKLLVYNMDTGLYPTLDQIKKDEWVYEECPFDIDKWSRLQTRDPAYGITFSNVTREDKNTKYSKYLIIPFFEDDTYEPFTKIGKFDKTILEIKNSFNLRTFPFDRQKIKIHSYNERYELDFWRYKATTYTLKRAEQFKEKNSIPGWNIKDLQMQYETYTDANWDTPGDGFSLIYELERKSRYYIFKIIFPILLILTICWSSVWIDPKEIESRLTITIVCLLSLIAYNFVIDSDLPKLEYLTIMDYIILISYVYAAIPNFLSIYSFELMKKNKVLTEKYESYEKKYGLPSYFLIILLIIIINVSGSPEHTNTMFSWAAMRN